MYRMQSCLTDCHLFRLFFVKRGSVCLYLLTIVGPDSRVLHTEWTDSNLLVKPSQIEYLHIFIGHMPNHQFALPVICCLFLWILSLHHG